MSRSYKKHPVCKDGRSGKVGKKIANRKVRNYLGDIANGKSYRKIYESWDIHDYISYYSRERNRREQEAETKSILNGGAASKYRSRITLSRSDWEKFYRRK